jgi:NAD(P)-dependent dehydrogenase (short-subunit alcohol dehydrogenase family)
MEIKDRVGIITGAGSGIGNAVSFELAKRGAKKLAMVDMTDQIEVAAEQVNNDANADIAVPFKGNVCDEDFRKQVFEEMESKYGMTSICIPAAGITRDDLAVRVDKETKVANIYPQENFELVVNVNLIAPVYWAMQMIANIAQDRAKRGLKKWHPDERVQGTIVFIGSISSQGNKGQVSYASTKAGLEGAAATLTKEAIFHGVRCGVIHPGFTDTPMVRAMGDDYIEKYVLPDTQLGRLIRPQEIADAICFMIANSAVSGELWADAGWHPSPA